MVFSHSGFNFPNRNRRDIGVRRSPDPDVYDRVSPDRSVRPQILQVGRPVLQEGRPARPDEADESLQSARRQFHVQHELIH